MAQLVQSPSQLTINDKIFSSKLNENDELYSQSKLIELSQNCDAVLTSLTDKMDEDTINKLPKSTAR